MTIRVKVDEDLPAEVASILRKTGHDATTVHEQGLGGTADSALWTHVQGERRCLVTADKGFADLTSFPLGSHHGIILLRLPRESRSGYLALARLLAASVDFDRIAGAIVIVRPEGIRIHPVR